MENIIIEGKGQVRLMKWLKTSEKHRTVFYYYTTSCPNEDQKHITLCPEAAALVDLFEQSRTDTNLYAWRLTAEQIFSVNWPNEYAILKENGWIY